MRKALILFVALGFVSCTSPKTETSLETLDTPSPGSEELECKTADADGQIKITLDSFEITPDCVEVKQSDAITIENVSDIEHNFTIKGREDDIDYDVAAGEPWALEPGIPVTPGKYTYYCQLHPDQMTGTLFAV